MFIIVKAVTTPHPVVRRHNNEKYFIRADNGDKENFPSIDDEPSVNLSVIVPAYDEEVRCKCIEAASQP